MNENGPDYDLSNVDVPEGHQATLRPIEGSDTPQISIEPVPANPEPDADDPVIQAAMAQAEDRESEIRDAWSAEHQRQMQEAHDAEIARAGEPTNIGTDGKPHFPVLRERVKAAPSEPDHDPAECGTCGTTWPCEQAEELERQHAEARGEQLHDVPAESGSDD